MRPEHLDEGEGEVDLALSLPGLWLGELLIPAELVLHAEHSVDEIEVASAQTESLPEARIVVEILAQASDSTASPGVIRAHRRKRDSLRYASSTVELSCLWVEIGQRLGGHEARPRLGYCPNKRSTSGRG